MKPEPVLYGDKRVYPVSAFNRGVASYLERLPTVWVEGEITELRRQPGWQRVFFTLKDLDGPAVVPVSMARTAFDGLRLDLADGDRVHVFARPELWETRGVFQLRALTIEPFGEGALLVRLERLKRTLAAEGLFAAERKRPLPLIPQRIGLVTGNDAAAKHDVLTTVTTRFPPARLLVAETSVQGYRAAERIAGALRARLRRRRRRHRSRAGRRQLRGLASVQRRAPRPRRRRLSGARSSRRSDTSRIRRSATWRPTPAPRRRPGLPGWSCLTGTSLLARLERDRTALSRCLRRRVERGRQDVQRDRLRLAQAPTTLLERKRSVLAGDRTRLSRAPRLALERGRSRLDGLAGRLAALSPAATLQRGYAIVRSDGSVVREGRALSLGNAVEVELAKGGFAARVEEVRE